jgi:A118 family predicted phage portal protein
MEYHRFLDNGQYAISNRCFYGDSEDDIRWPIRIEKTPWSGLAEEALIDNLDKPLFAIMRTPHANNIDINSPLSLPIFSDALEELKDLDIAYSRNAKEIRDSKRLVLLDSDRLFPTGGKIKSMSGGFDWKREEMGLPDYVKNVYGDGQNNFYEEVNPSLNTDTRLKGINALLSQIGYKIGFSNGYFVFNESTGIQTATGVEAEQQRTVQFIKDVRDKLESCLDDLIYSLNAFADLYDLAPFGTYEVTYNFGDIVYNLEEDKKTWYSYVIAGKIPFWYYLSKFEGMSEEEAKELEAAAQPKEPKLFGEEE